MRNQRKKRRVYEGNHGELIRDLRMLRGLTQEDLAFQLYRNKSTISQYENDDIDLRASVIEQLARVLNTKPGYFFGQEDNGIESEKGTGELLRNIKDDRFMKAAYEHLRIVSNTEHQVIS